MRHPLRHRRTNRLLDPFRIRMIIILASAFAISLAFAGPTRGMMLLRDIVTDSTYAQEFPNHVFHLIITTATLGILGTFWSRRIAQGRPMKFSTPLRNHVPRQKVMFPNTRALVVDHRLADRQQLRHQLEALGIEVSEEGNGSRAADRALNARFDVIFLCPTLPIMNGGMVREILHGAGIRTPIIMTCVTAEEAEQQQVDGAEYSIWTPIRRNDLCECLHRVIPRKAVSPSSDRMGQDLEAMQQALESEDFDQLIAIAQKLGDIASTLGSPDLTDSAQRLEACLLDEQPQESQLAEIRSALRELANMASGLDIGPLAVPETPTRKQIPK